MRSTSIGTDAVFYPVIIICTTRAEPNRYTYIVKLASCNLTITSTMSSSKVNYKDLSEVLLGNLTVDGLKKTIKQRHPNLTVQGSKDELQKRLAAAECLTPPAASGTGTATAASFTKAKPATSAKPKLTGSKLSPGRTGIPDVDARVDDLIGKFYASRMGKTKTDTAASTGSKKSHKCTYCNKRYTSTAHDVSDLTDGVCRKCALDEGLIIDCQYCKKKNVPEIFGCYCDGCDKSGCITHFPGGGKQDYNFCVECK